MSSKRNSSGDRRWYLARLISGRVGRAVSEMQSRCSRCRGAVGGSSFSPERGSRSRLIVLIQEPFSDDVIQTPLKVDGSALPGAQEGNPTSLKGGEGVGCSGYRRPLADDDGPGTGPGIEPGGIGGSSAVVGGATITNDCAWPSEQKDSPHPVVSRGNQAHGELDPVNGQGEPALTTLIRFTTPWGQFSRASATTRDTGVGSGRYSDRRAS